MCLPPCQKPKRAGRSWLIAAITSRPYRYQMAVGPIWLKD